MASLKTCSLLPMGIAVLLMCGMMMVASASSFADIDGGIGIERQDDVVSSDSPSTEENSSIVSEATTPAIATDPTSVVPTTDAAGSSSTSVEGDTTTSTLSEAPTITAEATTSEPPSDLTTNIESTTDTPPTITPDVTTAESDITTSLESTTDTPPTTPDVTTAESEPSITSTQEATIISSSESSEGTPASSIGTESSATAVSDEGSSEGSSTAISATSATSGEGSTVTEDTSTVSTDTTTVISEATNPSSTDTAEGSSTDTAEGTSTDTAEGSSTTVDQEGSSETTAAAIITDAPTTPEPAASTVDPCEGVECQNGGYCLDGKCRCTGPWVGESCECRDATEMCFQLKCEQYNGATCSPGCLEASCNCGQGLKWSDTLKRCENINECEDLGAGLLCSGAGIENVACIDLDPLDDQGNKDKLPYTCACPLNMVVDDGVCILRNDCENPVEIDGVKYECGMNPGEVPDTCVDTVSSFTCSCTGNLISSQGALYNEPKCIPRLTGSEEQCFDVANYGCYYSNQYDNACKLEASGAVKCDCPWSFMELENPSTGDIAGGPCKLKIPFENGTSLCLNAGKCGTDHIPCYRLPLVGDQCSCKSGFRKTSDGSCESIAENEVDSCSTLDEQTCADKHATCTIDSKGLKKCSCLEGYAGGNPPYTECAASCSTKTCGTGQYCSEDTENNVAVCNCLNSWQQLSEDGTCTTPDPCRTNNGTQKCATESKFCRYDPSDRIRQYSCDCYPPAVLDKDNNACRKPFGTNDTFFYDMTFTVFVTQEEAESLENRESVVHYQFKTLLEQALGNVQDDLAGNIVVSLSGVKPTEVPATTASPAGEVTSGGANTEGGEATTPGGEASASTEGEAATSGASEPASEGTPTSGPGAESTTDLMPADGSSPIADVASSTAILATADEGDGAGEGSIRRIRRSVIIDALLLERISREADVSLELMLAIATSVKIDDPEFLSNKLQQASVTVNGDSFLAINGIYIKWAPQTVKVEDANDKDVCTTYGSSQCPQNYECSEDASSSSNFYVCKCNSTGFEPFGMEVNGVVEICRDIDECARSDDEREGYCPNETGYDCLNTNGGYRCFCNDAEGYTDIAASGDRIECVDKCDERTTFGGACNGHGGSCKIDETTKVPYCECPEDKEGFTCELDRQTSGSDTDNASVVGGVLGALLAIVVIVAGVTIYKLRKKARKGGHAA